MSCYSVTKSCSTVCGPVDCSTPGFPVLHHVPEFAQIQVHWVSHAILPSHLLLPPSRLALFFLASGSFPVSWLFSSGSQSIGVSVSASVLPRTFRVDFLYDWLVCSCCPGDSEESSLAPQFESISSSFLSLLYGPAFTFIHDYWKNRSFNYMDLCWQSGFSAF